MSFHLSSRLPKRSWRYSLGSHGVRALALLLPLLVPGSSRADVAKAWELSLRAVGQIVQGQPAVAIQTLTQLRSHQSSPEVEGLVGIAALAGGRAVDGHRLLARAAARGTLPLLHYWAGRAAYQAGDPGSAREHLDRAVATGGDQPLFLIAQALIAKALARRTEALEALVSAARGWSNLADPRLYPIAAEGAIELLAPLLVKFPRPLALARTQGYLYWQLGRVLQAQERFASLVKSRPGDGDALQMLARCSHRLGHTEQAMALARRALKAAPELAAAHATYGELLLAAGDARAAVAELKRGADGRPRDAALLTLLAEACSRSHDSECAAEFFGYARRRNPRSIGAQIGLAMALQRLGDSKGAAQAAAAAVALQPVDPQVYEAAAHLARVGGDETRARRLAKRAQRHRRGFRALKRALQRRQRMLRAVARASQACACRPRCVQRDRSCRAATAQLRGSNRRFMLAHQALQAGRLARARSALRPVLRAAHPRRLLMGDPLRITRLATVDGRQTTTHELATLVAFDGR